MGKWLINITVMLVAAAIPCALAEAWLRITAPPADTAELFRKLSSPVEWSGRPHAEGQRIMAEALAKYLAPLLPPAGMAAAGTKP